MGEKIKKRNTEVQQQKRLGKLERLKRNRWYKEVRTLRVPRYIREKRVKRKG